jgi:glycerol-3-phosphate acyltransferase PlsX
MDVTLAIDAMGGDNAPRVVIAGLNRVLHRFPGTRFLLFGDERRIRPLLRRFRRLRSAMEIRHTDKVIGGGERVATALRAGRQSSMRKAIDAVAAGEADGVVSAGNTGALMAMAKIVLKTLPGIDRPAIAGLGPSMRGRFVMLDLGANVDCTADNLVQFAVMGEVFARSVLGLAEPKVGILNVGEEHLKGNEAVKRAAATLQQSELAIRFHGFVEGNDILEGTVDVIVTDGFTGNIALKSMEGAARLYTRVLREALTSSLLARVGALLAWPALSAVRRRVDPRLYNGAMFLGLNGVCVKSHGGTDAKGFANAVGVAVNLVADQVNDGIKEDFARLKGVPVNGLRVVGEE